ncbi:hypothetical protein E4413_11585 [Leptospira interrogans]|uniref:hypothetical protein n=1 Tax=Leptospira interrogans TaxID=173 RepID=UPI0002CA298B|nr:hypothetical protein [Leptospira interrogans]KAA1288411.1 hypothetical protein C4X99_23095 [Leptospira interrogans serovar Geyaweera]ENO71281.1 hypothetical protein LEP1GSC012_0862 [Leptospira interrogans serovar Valbuzzi str. Valbuzzi]QCO37008.1 hypothetical protein E4412_07145 [Leptospira interrogans]QCO41483.1 hypothetical protein E4413_11585 [Leptospira interrogans]ULG93808.1 hypothetical protein FH584_07990 [Leptospira interrogans]
MSIQTFTTFRLRNNKRSNSVLEKSFSSYFCLEFFEICELVLIILKTIDFEAVDSLRRFIFTV